MAIDSVVDERATVLDFGNGDISTFNWDGTLTRGTLSSTGIVVTDGTNNVWSKKPVSVKIGTAINSIQPYIFRNNDALVSFEMPDTVNSFGAGQFVNCYSLQRLKFSKNLKAIQSSMFNGCSSLNEVIIPEGVEKIYNYAFNSDQYHKFKISSLVIPKSVSSIISTQTFIGLNNCSIIFEDRTMDEVYALSAASNGPWHVPNNCKIVTRNNATQEWVKENVQREMVTLGEWQFSGSGYDPSKEYFIMEADYESAYVYNLFVDGEWADDNNGLPQGALTVNFINAQITATRSFDILDRAVNMVSV